MNNLKTGLLLTAFIFSGAACVVQPTVTSGSSNDQSRGGQHQGQPSAESVAACASRSSGDACYFEGAQGSETGTCFSPKESLPLACKSEKGNRPSGNRPSR